MVLKYSFKLFSLKCIFEFARARSRVLNHALPLPFLKPATQANFKRYQISLHEISHMREEFLRFRIQLDFLIKQYIEI